MARPVSSRQGHCGAVGHAHGVSTTSPAHGDAATVSDLTTQ